MVDENKLKKLKERIDTAQTAILHPQKKKKETHNMPNAIA